MSDWVLSSSIPNSSNKKLKTNPESDWVLSEPKQQESLGEAAMYAIPRIGVDIASGAYNAAQKIPEYWEKAKTEVPGFLNPLNAIKHPLRRAGQTLAGLLEAGQGLNRLPRNIAEYAENRLNLLPQGASQKVPVAPDISEAIQHDLGDPQYPGEALARGIGKNALNLASGASVINRLPHLTKRGAVKTLNKAQKLAEEREIGKLNVDPELIKDAKQFLPNLLKNRNALKAARAGDYKSLFKLQSDVGKLAGKQAKSWFSPSERIKGQAGLEARTNLLNDIHKNLKSMGHEDISNLLRKGQNEFRRYSKMKKYRNALGVVGAAYAAPKNPLTDLIKKWYSVSHQ